MMTLSDLKYDYPESLVAIAPAEQSRILLNQSEKIREIQKSDLLGLFQKGDVLVLNDTKVEKRRIFGHGIKSEFEILFVKQLSELEWMVLFPASRLKKNERVQLPDSLSFELVESGIPQKVRLNKPIGLNYFSDYGELPLPPYIQKARHERHNKSQDESWYQTEWAEKSGSQAAPTASLHFKKEDIETLLSRGVCVEKVTLHVGLGTFLPLKSENLDEHQMHSEWCSISQATYEKILAQKKLGHKVWALGTTVTRTLESCAHGKLQRVQEGWTGETDLFIRDNFEFKIVDNLLTNFHQPETTLLALVASFAGLSNVKKTYAYAVEKQFRLFSYGDLTVWIR